MSNRSCFPVFFPLRGRLKPELLIEKNRRRRALRHIRPFLKFALTSVLKLCLTCSPPQGKENPCPFSIHMPHPFILGTL